MMSSLKASILSCFAVATLLLSGCSTISNLWSGDKEGEGHDQSESVAEDASDRKRTLGRVAPSTLEEQELKLARLWSRVDDLEEDLYRQKERVRVLEKGFTLGLIPEEMKTAETPESHDKSDAHAPRAEVSTKHHALGPELLSDETAADAHKLEHAADSSGPVGLQPGEQKEYQAMLAQAHDQFRAGRYGRAIVDFDAIGKKFGDQVESGMHRYWIARSWAALKEYNTARNILTDFLKDHPASPWAPRGKIELARIEWKLGLQETALKRFRDIIKDHPYEDAAEMAKMELEHLDKTL